MGWLEPLERKLYEKPHSCMLPMLRSSVLDKDRWEPVDENPYVGLQPGDRWQCDDCHKVHIWMWLGDKYGWFATTPVEALITYRAEL